MLLRGQCAVLGAWAYYILGTLAASYGIHERHNGVAGLLYLQQFVSSARVQSLLRRNGEVARVYLLWYAGLRLCKHCTINYICQPVLPNSLALQDLVRCQRGHFYGTA